MKVENCPKCGGTHFGSYVCPFTDEDIQRMNGRMMPDCPPESPVHQRPLPNSAEKPGAMPPVGTSRHLHAGGYMPDCPPDPINDDEYDIAADDPAGEEEIPIHPEDDDDG